jgi:phage repressor protein C with HTH and peptisase S24 domain/DNA-binding XRE family transcriptional regulator
VKNAKNENILQVSKILLELRISSEKSQAEFAKLAGVSQRTWSSYESGQTTPKMGVLWALASKGYTIPGLTDSLIPDTPENRERYAVAMRLAKESPLDTPIDDKWAKKANTEYKNQHPVTSLKVYHSSDLPEGSFVVPLLDQRLSAGPGAALPEADEAKALIPVPSYLSRYGKDLAALTVDGDSMEPSLHRGDMVVCDSQGWSGEGIYAIRMGSSGFVKRITKRPGKVVVLSDNPKYPPQEEPEESDDFAIIGRVHCAITKVE